MRHVAQLDQAKAEIHDSKTQIAIEYAYRRREADAQLWVLWVHASSVARFEESYRQIARQVGISGWEDAKIDVLPLVHTWLSDERNGRWTMVIDNADNSEVMFGVHSDQTHMVKNASTSPGTRSSGQILAAFLPTSAHGSIIITSRNREVTAGLIEYVEDVLEVDSMTKEDAITLLTNKLKRPGVSHDPAELSALVHELGNIPLAIAQAAAYINQLDPPMTVSQYSEKLARSDTDRDQLLQVGIRDPRRDGESSNSIITTWHASFEHIRQVRGSAARLLALMSLFDRDSIPTALLKGQYHLSHEAAQIGDRSTKHDWRLSQQLKNITLKWSKKEPRMKNKPMVVSNHDNDDLEQDIMTLRTYSLVSLGTNKNLLGMHRLVQYSTRKWLELHHELTLWQTRYAGIMRDAFPNGEYANWPTCQALFPHVEALMLYEVDSRSFHRSQAVVAYRGSCYACGSGKYRVAERLASKSKEILETNSDLDPVLLLDSLYVLGLVLKCQGKYKQSEELLRRALAGTLKEYGSESPETLNCMDGLAATLRNQGMYNEVEQLTRQVLAGWQKLQPDHPETLSSMSNLAATLYCQGKLDEAEQLHRQTLARKQEKLGGDDLYTLDSLHCLGLVLMDQGKYSEAEPLYQRALSGRLKKLGSNHPNTLTTLYSLAILLHRQGKYNEAEQLYRRALAGRRKELGADHPSTVHVMRRLAEVLGVQGKGDEAEQLEQQVLAADQARARS